jgi:hypothetical protein
VDIQGRAVLAVARERDFRLDVVVPTSQVVVHIMKKIDFFHLEHGRLSLYKMGDM